MQVKGLSLQSMNYTEKQSEIRLTILAAWFVDSFRTDVFFGSWAGNLLIRFANDETIKGHLRTRWDSDTPIGLAERHGRAHS